MPTTPAFILTSLQRGVQALRLLLGCAAGLWSVMILPASWSAAPAKSFMAHILADDRFKAATLNEVLAMVPTSPERLRRRSDWVRAEALIRLRIAEEALGRQSPGEADGQATALDDKLKSSLAFNPTDSFLWLVLYSLEITRHGFEEGAVGFLSKSYETGPLEGWISLRRNNVALAAFASLSAGTQAVVVAEFSAMVDSDFVEIAARNLMGGGWKEKDRLVASLANVELIPREAFAKRLSREGLKVSIPGVYLDERLWR